VIAFRNLRPADLPTIYRLEAQLYEPALRVSDEAFAALLAVFPDGAFGLFDDSELCGFAFGVPLTAGAVLDLSAPLTSLPPDADTFYIHNLGVAPRYRGHGLAGRLVTALLDLARAQGFRTCELVSVQGSAPFWEHFGFSRIGELEYAPGATAVQMRAVLPAVGS
jgi:ribosomal protein S18 acetylase RimI-like enzyme